MESHYTYRISWSPEDQEYIGLCVEFPSLSWLANNTADALNGIIMLVKEVVQDMKANNEPIPKAIADRHYSGEFRVRIPPMVHRNIAIAAAEQGVSMNRYVASKLSA